MFSEGVLGPSAGLGLDGGKADRPHQGRPAARLRAGLGARLLCCGLSAIQAVTTLHWAGEAQIQPGAWSKTEPWGCGFQGPRL